LPGSAAQAPLPAWGKVGAAVVVTVLRVLSIVISWVGIGRSVL
jgi:hypothetical protein